MGLINIFNNIYEISIMEGEPKRKIAGFWTQIRLILWKNTLLYRRNISGLICEILFATIFILVMLAMICQSFDIENPYPYNNRKSYDDYFLKELTQKSDIFYYPQGKLSDTLMKNTFSTLKIKSYSSKSELFSTNVTSP